MRLSLRSNAPFCGVAALPLFGASPAAAHGLGERYSLPLPLNLYLIGAALVVALTFIALAWLGRSGAASSEAGSAPEWRLPTWRGARYLELAVRWVSALLFVLLLLAGFIGSQDPFRNPLPVSVWVLGWVGIAYVCALVGNVWAVINPWDNIFRAAEWLSQRSGNDRLHTPPLAYPAVLGAWPAAFFFLAFAWMELVWPARDHPGDLAAAMLAYSAVTWAAMAVFGRRTWLENGEFLTVAFGLLARFSVIGRQDDYDRLVVRPPARGLLVRKPVPLSVSAFAVLMLASVTFDGILETLVWASLSQWAAAVPALRHAGAVLGVRSELLFTSAALFAFPLIFAALYLAVVATMTAAARSGGYAPSVPYLAGLFVLTLVPIAIGYHLSHYLSYLLIAGQFIIPIASDPFALGWNLFGTRLYLIDFSIVNARLVWYASLLLIVGGHVIAVWLAHVQAERQFASRSLVLRSQLPMALLMVGYTALSLWILAQPIVENP